jgi:hypothetical protein
VLVFLGDRALLVGSQLGLGELLVHFLPQRAGRARVGVEGVVGGEPVILQGLRGSGDRGGLRLLPRAHDGRGLGDLFVESGRLGGGRRPLGGGVHGNREQRGAGDFHRPIREDVVVVFAGHEVEAVFQTLLALAVLDAGAAPPR